MYHATHLGNRTLALAIPASLMAKQQQQQAVASYCHMYLSIWCCPFISLIIWCLLNFTFLQSGHYLASFNMNPLSHPNHNEIQTKCCTNIKSACAFVCMCLSKQFLKTLAGMFCFFIFQDTPSAAKSSKLVRVTMPVFWVGLTSFPK